MKNMDIHYTSERSVQIIIYLLKSHGIKDIIASPGATNVTFVASVQHDSFFNVYSCVDERSAAYMACGIAAQTGKPVVLSCTGATSSRNYLPGLTEAYYSNLPIMAITSMMNPNQVGNLTPQATDRSTPPKDAIKRSYHLPVVTNSDEEWEVTNKVNEAILELTRRGGGPTHLRLTTNFSKNYTVTEIPPVRVIKRITCRDNFPSLNNGRIVIFVGSHKLWSEDLTNKVEKFCKAFDVPIFCDKTSNYYGSHRIDYALAGAQNFGVESVKCDLLIHLGGISGDYYTTGKITPKEVWRVDEDGEIRDRFKKLTKVFEMGEDTFFDHYSKIENTTEDKVVVSYKKIYKNLLSRFPDLPFSNIWIASFLYDKLPNNAILYLGILNSLRAWNFFEIPNEIPCYSNVGGFGIDGLNSTLLGAALVKPDNIFFEITGDLGFFYDINSLGNRDFPKNIRILLINNGRGQEFRNYRHVGDFLGDSTDEYISAARHNGNMSPVLTRHFAEDLGFKYMCASSKEKFKQLYSDFVESEIGEQPIIFEVFTDTTEETNALKTVLNINDSKFSEILKKSIIKTANDILPQSSKDIIKKIIK